MGLSEILQYLRPVCWVEQDRTDAEFLSSIEDQNIESSMLEMFQIKFHSKCTKRANLYNHAVYGVGCG